MIMQHVKETRAVRFRYGGAAARSTEREPSNGQDVRVPSRPNEKDSRRQALSVSVSLVMVERQNSARVPLLAKLGSETDQVN